MNKKFVMPSTEAAIVAGNILARQSPLTAEGIAERRMKIARKIKR
ncbi:MAG: hypothetical protein WCA15_03855 [Candidatus Acidiferrales bacterium]